MIVVKWKIIVILGWCMAVSKNMAWVGIIYEWNTNEFFKNTD